MTDMDAADVMVVDDDRLNRALALAVLDSAGLSSCVADNARDCLEVYAAARPRCVLMDLRLGGDSGVEVARAIRQLESRLGLRPATLVAVSAYSEATQREQCRQAGMDAYLEKPYQPAELVELVKRGLRLKQPAA